MHPMVQIGLSVKGDDEALGAIGAAPLGVQNFALILGRPRPDMRPYCV